ncbi:MAG: ATP-binding cassette domain-containing protein [Bacteroidetes bacterium]|nr:ATP-binding cassette domain-containing protein [Bacteroidota bacterium]
MENHNTNPVTRFIRLLQINKQDVLSVYLYAAVAGVISLSLPLGIQAIMNFITAAQISTSWVVLVALVVGGVLLAGFLQILLLTVTENLQQRIFTHSAFEFAYRLPRMKMNSLQKYHVPELVNRFFDTLTVQKGISKVLIDFSAASLQIIFGLLLLSFYHPFFIFFSCFLLLSIYLIFRLLGPAGIKTSLKESKYKYEVAYWLEEVGRTTDTFKAAENTAFPEKKTDEILTQYLNARKGHFKVLRLQYANMIAFKALMAAVLLLVGGYLVIHQKLNVGQFVASEIIIILVLSSVEKLILSLETMYDVLTALEKIGYVTDIELDDEQTKSEFTQESTEGISIKTDDLFFQYSDASAPTINQLNIDIKKGERVLLSGWSGSGKSALLRLLAGMRNDYQGTITLNELPIQNWQLQSLRKNIAYCQNGEQIFHGTFIDNILVGREISIEKVKDVIQILKLNNDVNQLHGGYDTLLFPGGKNLSATTRLKIVMARAIIASPQLLLLEDSFNAIPLEQRIELLKGIFSFIPKSTVIAISNDEHLKSLFHKQLTLTQA